MQQIVYYDENQLDSGTPLLRHVSAPGVNLHTDLNGRGLLRSRRRFWCELGVTGKSLVQRSALKRQHQREIFYLV